MTTASNDVIGFKTWGVQLICLSKSFHKFVFTASTDISIVELSSCLKF